MKFLIILFIIIFILIIIGIIYISLFNKINETIIRVDEAEARIDSNLRDKYDLINKSITLIKNIIKLEDDKFKDIIKLRARKISNFDLDRILVKEYNEFVAIYNKNKDIRNNDEIFKINKQILLIDEELITLRNYYNANISTYNGYIRKFPTNIIAKIKKYNERPFYDLKNMKDDDYEDFKL